MIKEYDSKYMHVYFYCIISDDYSSLYCKPFNE